jgi:FRG domain
MNLPDDYWEYYNPDYSWADDSGLADWIASAEFSQDQFSKNGFGASETEALLASGYIAVFGVVIDRYYGGLLRSTDSRTRFAIKDFARESATGSSDVPVYRAQSIGDLRACVERWQSSLSRRVLFRGQIESYAVRRPHPNPFFQVPGYGEVSLLPSLWRRMIARRATARQNFRNLYAIEWQRILQSTFDLKEIERRVESARGAGEWIHSSQDLEDSDDPMLSKLGRLQLDLAMGRDFNFATPLQTLLQHYGLLSPVLDLTSDLDVALFFATHRYQPGSDGELCSYTNVGTNGRQSVIYVIRENKTEMEVHGRDRILEDLDPLRPKRQSCVVCRSGPDAMNLAADFLYGIIALDFDDLPPIKYDVLDLFPGLNSDRFLRALKANVRHPQYVTVFAS